MPNKCCSNPDPAFLFETFIRMMRLFGLTLVINNRHGFNNLESYKSYMKDLLTVDRAFQAVTPEQVDQIIDVIAEHAQTIDSDFAAKSRNIEQAFVDNDRVVDLESQVLFLKMEIIRLNGRLSHDKYFSPKWFNNTFIERLLRNFGFLHKTVVERNIEYVVDERLDEYRKAMFN